MCEGDRPSRHINFRRHPKQSIQHSGHGESLKSRIFKLLFNNNKKHIVYTSVSIFSELTQQLRQEQYVRCNYMFRPSKWAIIWLFTKLVGRLYSTHGEYLGDEIYSYFIVRGVNIGYQRYIQVYVCTCHLKCMHNPYLALACRWPSVITI